MAMNLEDMPFFQEQKKLDALKPEILKAMKEKYLVAIGKSDRQDLPRDVDDKNVFVFGSMADQMKLCLYWRDAEVDKIITSMKQLEFNASVYVSCAKTMFMFYLGIIPSVRDDVFAYLLFFARDYKDTTKNVFNLEGNGTRNINPETPDHIANNTVENSTKFMKQIQKLLDKLCVKFDEDTYVKLNVNVTYILLIILRRKIVSEQQLMNAFKTDSTHECYKELCPYSLDDKLPMPGKFEMNSNGHIVTLALVLHASRTADGVLKRVLNATCLKHMEGHGLALPTMFNRVVDLYNVSESDLWDLLCVAQTSYSLSKLYQLYNFQYNNREEHSFSLFPYCGVYGGDYHSDMSGPSNQFLCTALAYLIDMKIGMDKSSVRNAHWAKSNFVSKAFGERLAKAVYEKIS